jgi:hypothetical protein
MLGDGWFPLQVLFVVARCDNFTGLETSGSTFMSVSREETEFMFVVEECRSVSYAYR